MCWAPHLRVNGARMGLIKRVFIEYFRQSTLTFDLIPSPIPLGLLPHYSELLDPRCFVKREGASINLNKAQAEESWNSL